jgi:hypothetical protein
MIMSSTVNLDWIEVMGTEGFRGFVQKYQYMPLRKLREDLVEKAQGILNDLALPPEDRIGRRGVPMSPSEYDEWHVRASTALKKTEEQIRVVNGVLWQHTENGLLSRPVLERILDLAEQGADFGESSEEDRNALRILQHYMGDR